MNKKYINKITGILIYDDKKKEGSQNLVGTNMSLTLQPLPQLFMDTLFDFVLFDEENKSELR